MRIECICEGVSNFINCFCTKNCRLRQPSLVGITQIEVHGRVLSFKAHDPHLERDPRLKAEVKKLAQEILSSGHVPDLSHVDTMTLSSTPMSEKEKMWSLCTHSERIAIAYGLIHLAPNEPLQLTKNLRVCRDCHDATKLISKIRNRKIIGMKMSFISLV